jgi:hypothetical protein
MMWDRCLICRTDATCLSSPVFGYRQSMFSISDFGMSLQMGLWPEGSTWQILRPRTGDEIEYIVDGAELRIQTIRRI